MVEIKNAVEVSETPLKLVEDLFRYDGALLLGVYQKEDGQKVIESWCDKDVDEVAAVSTYHYYTVPVSDDDLEAYKARDLTLKAIIQKADKVVFEVITESNDESKSVFLEVKPEDFPEEYMPAEDSYCM